MPGLNLTTFFGGTSTFSPVFGLRAILETHGFTIIEQHKSVDDIRAVFQLLNAYLYKKTVSDNKFLTVLATVFLMAPWNVLGELLNLLLPRNEDFYLDNVLLARKSRNA